MNKEQSNIRRAKAQRGCKDAFGFVPTEEQGEDALVSEPGAVKLVLAVIDSQYGNRIKNKEKY